MACDLSIGTEPCYQGLMTIGIVLRFLIISSLNLHFVCGVCRNEEHAQGWELPITHSTCECHALHYFSSSLKQDLSCLLPTPGTWALSSFLPSPQLPRMALVSTPYSPSEDWVQYDEGCGQVHVSQPEGMVAVIAITGC